MKTIYRLIIIAALSLGICSCDNLPDMECNVPNVDVEAEDIEAESVKLIAYTDYYNAKNAYFMVSRDADMSACDHYEAYHTGSSYTTYYRNIHGLEPGTKYYYRFVLPNNNTYQEIETSVKSFVTDTRYRQTITWNTSYTDKYVGDGSFTFNAKASSGLPVTYTITEGADHAKLSGTYGETITIISNGTVKVTATQAGNDKYYEASPVVKVIEIHDNKLIFSDVDVDNWGDQSAGSGNVTVKPNK